MCYGSLKADIVRADCQGLHCVNSSELRLGSLAAVAHGIKLLRSSKECLYAYTKTTSVLPEAQHTWYVCWLSAMQEQASTAGAIWLLS